MSASLFQQTSTALAAGAFDEFNVTADWIFIDRINNGLLFEFTTPHGDVISLSWGVPSTVWNIPFTKLRVTNSGSFAVAYSFTAGRDMAPPTIPDMASRAKVLNEQGQTNCVASAATKIVNGGNYARVHIRVPNGEAGPLWIGSSSINAAKGVPLYPADTGVFTTYSRRDIYAWNPHATTTVKCAVALETW